jgi:hypothetical protein
MTPAVEQLRETTLANNLAWLRSFGCRTQDEGDGVVRVEHATLPDFCALLLMSPTARARRTLREFLAEVEGAHSAPDVYVEEELEKGGLGAVSVEEALAARGFARLSANTTTAGEWTPRAATPELRARAATPEEHARWSALYSEGFGRAGRDARLDLARWELSFNSAAVVHWFFVGAGGEEVGVCQTCEASGVVGIYSFTLAPALRGPHALASAIHALRARLTERGKVLVYFERAKRKRARLPHHPANALRPAPGFKVIRVTAGYSRLLDRH